MQNAGEQIRLRRQKFTNEIRRQHRQQLFSKRRNLDTQTNELNAQSSEKLNQGSSLLQQNSSMQSNSQKIGQQGVQATSQQVSDTKSSDAISVQSNTLKTNSKFLIIDPRFPQIAQFHASAFSSSSLPSYISSLQSSDIVTQHYGMISIRKLLTSTHPPIQQVVDAGLVPLMIAYAKQTEYPQMQLEAVWCLTNIASGNNSQTGPIIERGGISVFIQLLLSSHIGIVEQAIWILGNIARDSPSYRDKIIKQGGIKNLVKLVQIAIGQLPKNPNMKDIIQSSAWTLAGICQTAPIPQYNSIKQALAVFYYALKNNLISDLLIIGNICFAISNYTKKGSSINAELSRSDKIDKIQICIDSEVVPRLIEFLQHNNDNIAVGAVKIIGNIATGTNKQSQYLTNLGIVSKLYSLLGRNKKILRREACWVLSNLTAGSKKDINAVLGNQELITKLLQMLKQDDLSIRSQIFYIFSNAAEQADPKQLLNFYSTHEIVKQFVDNMRELSATQPENETPLQRECLQSILQNLYKLLKFGKKNSTGAKKTNYFYRQLHKQKAVSILEKLQYHEDDNVYEQVSKIIGEFFQIENPLEI